MAHSQNFHHTCMQRHDHPSKVEVSICHACIALGLPPSLYSPGFFPPGHGVIRCDWAWPSPAGCVVLEHVSLSLGESYARRWTQKKMAYDDMMDTILLTTYEGPDGLDVPGVVLPVLEEIRELLADDGARLAERLLVKQAEHDLREFSALLVRPPSHDDLLADFGSMLEEVSQA